MQIKNSFDKETLKKIGKGALITASGTTALYLLDWIGTIDAGTWTPIIALVVPVLVNAIREYLKGQ